YFSVAEGSWNYRIIGRARVLEIYRLLVLAGVNPNAIRMSSLGPLDERREYLGKPPGTIVDISSHSANELNCKAIQSASSDQKLHADLPTKDELTLDYLILDGDPKASDLQSYRDQIRLHKAIHAETMHIISYADSPGSRYLNKVLSRLRALVLFRIATLEGYRPDAIDLSWQGEVTRECVSQ
ncbi:MAG: hypothetical protein NTX25_20295, partial [Proteobacteria bacterium]|nr:hypothetical protein [Pseudomonadota bacterium]